MFYHLNWNSTWTSGEAQHEVIHCPSLSIPFQNHLTVLLRGAMKMFRLEDSVTVSVLGHLLSTLAHSNNRVMTPPVISNLNLAIADSISFRTNQEQFCRPISSQFHILKKLIKFKIKNKKIVFENWRKTWNIFRTVSLGTIRSPDKNISRWDLKSVSF